MKISWEIEHKNQGIARKYVMKRVDFKLMMIQTLSGPCKGFKLTCIGDTANILV